MDFKSRNFDLPENIFYFFNQKLDPLSFVLDWDTSDKFYFNLLNRYFANVLDKPNEHSMVLANPNDSTYFHDIIPAFDIKYIEQCFDLKDFPDPTEYLIKKSCAVTYTKQDIVDCWIHQKKSWSDLIPVQNNYGDNESEISSIKSCYKKMHYDFDSDSNFTSVSNNKHIMHKTTSTALLKEDTNSEDSSDSNQQSYHMPSSSTSTLSKKKSRLPYTHKEDAEIVKYIVKNKYAFNITGRTMWQNMERANVCKIRTWQSMKERYLKHIKFELKSGNYKFPFLSKNDLKLLRQGLHVDVIKKNDVKKLKSKFQDERIDEWISD